MSRPNPRTQSQGICAFCGHRAIKAAMARHSAACVLAHDDADAPSATLVRLRVEAAGDRRYWLDVDIAAAARLRALDRFLRDAWLECCGHMSAFTIRGVRYEIAPTRDWSFDALSGPRARSMNASLDEALSPGLVFHYEYDFGTTTALRLRVMSVRRGRLGRPPVRLLARNEPATWPCAVCGAPATDVCSFCVDDRDDVFFCKDHAAGHIAEAHEGDNGFLPAVNSPRMGVCGYTGPRNRRYEVPPTHAVFADFTTLIVRGR